MKVLLLIVTVVVGVNLPVTESSEDALASTASNFSTPKNQQGPDNEEETENVTFYDIDTPEPVTEKATEGPEVEDGPKCGRPPPLENSKLDEIRDEYAVGSKVTYKCDFGYVTQGRSRTVECLQKKNGKVAKWAQLRVSCVPRSCGDPGYVPNARRVGSVFTFPNQVTYQCDEGYNIKGSAARYCLASGTWSGNLPSCQKVSCNPPEEPENGKAVYWSLEYGSELTYECNKGFVIQDPQPRICSGTGTWSGGGPKCIETACQLPSAPQYGSVEILGGRAKVDSIAMYKCDGDRIVVGSATSKCLSTGQWTFDTPKCLSQCIIPYISGGKLGKYEIRLMKRNREYVQTEVFVPSHTGLKVNSGHELFLQCDTGYTIRGTDKVKDAIICEDGTWSQDMECVSGQCTVPYISGGKLGKYEMRLMKRNREYVETGVFVPSHTGHKVNSGHELFLQCDTGYTIKGTQKDRDTVICEDRTWSQDLECVSGSCRGKPPVTPNAYISNIGYYHGATITYFCNEYYTKAKYGNVTCLYGDWLGVTPICADTRCYADQLAYPGLEKIGNGVYNNGSSFAVVCKNGYELTEPNSKFLCKSGTWEGPKSPCTAGVCSEDPPKITNGHAVGFNRDHESIIRYNCDEHYLLRGESTVQCWYGEWIGDTPTCTDSRCYLKDLKRKGGVTELSSNITVSGARLRVKCADGHVPSSPLPLCFNGAWHEEPACIRTDEEVMPEEVNVYEDNFLATAPSPETDDVFEEATTSSQLAPTEGLVEQPKFEEKPQVPEARNATTKAPNCFCIYNNRDVEIVAFSGDQELEYGNRVKLGDTVKFHCRTLGYKRLNGSSELKCKSCETWRQQDFPICLDPQWGDTNIVVDEKKIRILPGGVIGIREGHTFEFICYGSDNYSPPVWFYHGPNFPPGITVKSYGIVGYSVVCMKIERAEAIHTGTYGCRIPSKRSTNLQLKLLAPCSFDDAFFSGIYNTGKNIYETGESFQPFCLGGFKTSNPEDSRLTCENGVWKGHLPPCKPVEDKRCEAFKEDLHIIHYDNDRTVNSSALFSCKKLGYRPVGPIVLNCLPDGKWSGSPPECEGVTCPDLGDIEGMKISYSDHLNVGSTVTFQCIPPRILTKSYYIKCDSNGTWSSPPPSCEIAGINCPDISNTEGMTVSFSDELHVRSTATFHCFPPRMLNGASQIRCKVDGSWSGPLPSCSLSNCTLETLFELVPENVVPVVQEVTGDAIPYNSSLSLTCDGNLTLIGNAAAKCGGLGRWEVGKPQCVRGCSPVKKPPSSQLIIEPKKAFFKLGESMIYKCPDGLTLIPDIQRVLCLGDRWSETKIPECLAEATSLSAF